MESKPGKDRGIFLKRSPLPFPESMPTDIIQVGPISFAVTHSCGVTWIANVKDSAPFEALFSLKSFSDFAMQEIKPSYINSIDCMIVNS